MSQQNETHSIRIDSEAKRALDLLAASKQITKQEAASEAIKKAWDEERQKIK